jgi:hypothetical protein
MEGIEIFQSILGGVTMKEKFIPNDFVVPAVLETYRFRLRILTANDVEKDYEAVMSSLEHLKNPLTANWDSSSVLLRKYGLS